MKAVGPLIFGYWGISMQQGTVKWFDEKKGFGFISAGTKDLFVHFRAISTPGFKTLHEGQKVEFTIGKSPKGECAENVSIVD